MRKLCFSFIAIAVGGYCNDSNESETHINPAAVCTVYYANAIPNGTSKPNHHSESLADPQGNPIVAARKKGKLVRVPPRSHDSIRLVNHTR